MQLKCWLGRIFMKQGERMNAMTIFLLSIIFGIIIISIVGKIANSRAFRIWSINKKWERKEKAEEKFDFGSKNKDEIDIILEKIRNGEEVEIPLQAFNYIYSKINKFSIIQKDGTIRFVNPEEYLEFKKKAQKLLTDSKEKTIDAAKIFEEIEEHDRKKPIEFEELEDGTIVKRDNIKMTIEQHLPDGTIKFIDLRNNKMITKRKKKKEEDEKKERESKEHKEWERKQKKLEQKMKLMEEKFYGSKSTKIDDKNTKVDKDNKPKKMDENIEKEEQKKIEKEEQKQEIVEENDTFIDEDDFPIQEQQQEKKEVETETKELNIEAKEEIKYSSSLVVPDKDLLFKFFDKKLFLNDHISHRNVKKILLFLLTNDADIVQNSNSSCIDMFNKCVIFYKKVDAILINVNWFAYKFFATLADVNQQKLFLDSFYTNIDIGSVDNDFLSDFIEELNKASAFGFGSKILYQEEKENGTISNFKSIRISDDEDHLYRSVCLHLFLNNPFGREFKKTLFFTEIEHNDFRIIEDDSKGGKWIRFSDIVDVKE